MMDQRPDKFEVPVYFIVGDGEKCEIGKVVLGTEDHPDLATMSVSAVMMWSVEQIQKQLPGILREAADNMEAVDLGAQFGDLFK